MPFKENYTVLGSSQTYKYQLNSNSVPSWQDQNLNWKPGQPTQSPLENCSKMSGNCEGYHFISGQVLWDLKEPPHSDLTNVPNDLMTPVGYKNYHTGYNTSEAALILKVPPQKKFRYRYDTEMSGTHGSLQGIKTGRENSVPTVELVNYPFEALIRVTLVTGNENEHYPHPHSLFVKEKLYQKKHYENWGDKCLTKTGHYCDPHYIRVGRLKDDYTARFEGMCIINSKKEYFHASVKEKLQRRCFELNTTARDEFEKGDESEILNRKVETAVSCIDVNFVCLCFEAFREENGKLFPICQPIYSEPIGNLKNPNTGNLKITRINKCSGSCKGGDEIWLLVEKINKKGLVARFWEECNGKIVWESRIEGDDLTLHHQYAIIFKTPPYRDVNISSEIEVLMRLERATQPNQPCDTSKPITFVYEPSKSKFSKGDNLYRKESILTPLKQSQTKRPRTELTGTSPLNHQSKRRTDDLVPENMNFEESYLDQFLDSNDAFELGTFNEEEFLRFIATDDMDMQIQRDGVHHTNKSRRDFFYKLYLLYSKLDENDMKKLTDEISNFRVSKKEISESKNGMEKDQVKDAASTLLTLRSKALINNNSRTSNSNIPDFLDKVLPQKNPSLESCESDSEAKSPVHMSVIKFHLSQSKFSGKAKSGKILNESEGATELKESNHKGVEDEPFVSKTIKKEKTLPDFGKLENVCRILNANGSWKKLAELWNCSKAVTSAMESPNQAQYIFDYFKQVQGIFEPEMLKDSLEIINEKEALKAFNEILA